MATKTYRSKRAAEHRADCLTCSTSDERCTEMVLTKGKACCSTCGYTDTHPKPKGARHGEPCIHCGGSGIEPAECDG
jgi:hypothetical protein